jgi:ABC-2 type transport system permease protein
MWLRVSALLLRYLYLYRRSPVRAGEIFFWPVMNLLLWGFVLRQAREKGYLTRLGMQ